MTLDINTDAVFRAIKKQNGEQFAKVLRAEVLLDIPNLPHILEYAGNNSDDAVALVPVLREIQQKNIEPETTTSPVTKSPLELLSDAGYDAFYVETLEQQNSIKKYFRPDEELCTFRDDRRYKDNYIIHAVKRGADQIKPQKKPEREDKYGTSVISIQIAKSGGFISIKNRYNHTVQNPDATFNNNPDNIIDGLSESLKQWFNVDFITRNAELPHNYCMVNNQLVRFNYEIDNTYFDERYYFRGSEITKINPGYEVILDNVVFDNRTNRMRSVLPGANSGVDGFVRVLNAEIGDNIVSIEKDKTTKEIVLKIQNEQELIRAQNGCITVLNLYKATEVGASFMLDNKRLKMLYAPQLQKIDNECFSVCKSLETIDLPKLEKIGKECFEHATSVKAIKLPKLKEMGAGCFEQCKSLETIDLPDLQIIGEGCFGECGALKTINLPKLEKIGDGCFEHSGLLPASDLQKLAEIKNTGRIKVLFRSATKKMQMIMRRVSQLNISDYKQNSKRSM